MINVAWFYKYDGIEYYCGHEWQTFKAPFLLKKQYSWQISIPLGNLHLDGHNTHHLSYN